MVEELSHEEVVEAIDRTVKELLQAANVLGPPVDAVALAHTHLALSAEPRHRPGRRRTASFTETTPEQQQGEAALQIGDHLKPELLRQLGINPQQPRPMMGASLSRLVAEHLLLPRDWFARDATATGFDVLALAETYSTSHAERIAWRLLDLAEPCIITVLDDDRILKRRSNAWSARKELASAEKQCQRYVSDHDQLHVIRADGWTVQGWPIPHDGGRRVVLRSVVEDP